MSHPWLQASKIAPLDPAKEGKDQSRVLGGDDGPFVLHTSQGIDAEVDKEILCCCGGIYVCLRL